MAVSAYTQSPGELLKAIKKAIDDKEVGTWAYDGDGDFYHTPEQWKGKAWLRPVIQQGMLSFGLLGQKDIAMTKLYYAVYHGRFIEMLLSHFDNQFSIAVATAQADSVDQFK